MHLSILNLISFLSILLLQGQHVSAGSLIPTKHQDHHSHSQFHSLSSRADEPLPPNPNDQIKDCVFVGIAPFCFPSTCPDGLMIKSIDAKGDGHKCIVGVKWYCCPPEVDGGGPVGICPDGHGGKRF